jgi:hypothetical protein
MMYARAHDQTVEADYFTAMHRVEQRLVLVSPEADPRPVGEEEPTELLKLATQLAEPELEQETRLALVARIRLVLNREKIGEGIPSDDCGRRQPMNPEQGNHPDHPPPSPAFLGVASVYPEPIQLVKCR